MRSILLPAPLFLFLALCCVALVGDYSLAQDDLLPPDEVQDLVERYVERGIESFREGGYDEARLRFKKALKRDPKNLGARMGTARCDLALGAYGKARALAQQVLVDYPEAREPLLLIAEVDLREGKTTAVRQAMRKLFEADGTAGNDGTDGTGGKWDSHRLRAGLLLASAFAANGKRDRAKDALDKIVAQYKRRYEDLAEAAFDADELKHDPIKAWPISEEMTIYAAALRLYVELFPIEYDYAENAIELVGFARKLDEANWEAWIEYVRITRLERGRAMARARKARAVVSKRNPELADLYVEVALSLQVGWNQAEVREMARSALVINPQHAGAHAILAKILMEDNIYDGAAEHLDKALAVNPRHRESLALRATLSLLKGDRDAFEAGMKKVLEVDPTFGRAFHLAGTVVASRQRRFEDAYKLIVRGLKIDPTNFEAHADAGIYLHPIRENFRTVLEYVTGSMVEQKTEHFVIRYDPAEYEIHSLFLPQALEDSWTDMVKRYGFEPDKPVLVECFKKQDDFSVRSIGLPGIPALGACFGGLITLDAPRAFGSPFNWHSTAVHEFAHVVTLQLSAGQVPRWFTEGVSVLEEKPFTSNWGREEGFERALADEFLTNTLPKIETFDGMFRSSRVGYAYYVGGLMLQFLRGKYGEEGIVKALRLWAKDAPQEKVFREAFDLGLEEFDKLFRAVVAKRVASYNLTPNYALIYNRLLDEREKSPKDGSIDAKIGLAHLRNNELVDAGSYLDQARRKGAGDDPLSILLAAHLKFRSNDAAGARAALDKYFAKGGGAFNARMMMVRLLGAGGEANADKLVEQAKLAKKAWPLRAIGTNPYSILYNEYLRREMDAEALAEIEQQAEILATNVKIRMRLAREYMRNDRIKDAVRVLEQAILVTNFDRGLHAALLPLYRKLKETKKAVRAARCRVALRTDEDDDIEVAAMWLDLADVLLDAGQAKEARSAFDEAKKLADSEDLPRIADIERRLGT